MRGARAPLLLACAAAARDTTCGGGTHGKCTRFLAEQARNLSAEPTYVPSPVVWGNGTRKAAATARRSGGCGKRLPHGVTPGVLETRDISVNDPGFSGTTSRRYRIFYPSDYDANNNAPVFFHFHGWGGSEASQNQFHNIGAREGAITIYMRGMGDGDSNSWNNNNHGERGAASCTSQLQRPYPICYNSCERLGECGPCNTYTCADDHLFVQAVLDRTASESCVDLGRVYAGGMSNGGGAAFTVPEGLPDVFAATVPVKGLPFPGVYNPGGRLRDTAMLSLIGTNDCIIPIDGSPSWCAFVYVSQAAAMRAWADIHGCGNGDTPYSTPYNVDCRAFTGCAHGTGSVVSCTTGGGHNYPNVGYELTWWYILQHSRP